MLHQAKIQKADTFLKRLIGLSFISPYVIGTWLFIPYCNTIHTFGMRYEITAIGLDEFFDIVDIQTHIKHNKIIKLKSRHILEVSSYMVPYTNQYIKQSQDVKDIITKVKLMEKTNGWTNR